MTFNEYINYFESILAHPEKYPLYTDPIYLDYVRLNWARMNRWLKKFEVSEVLATKIAQIDNPQKWIVITEPWCGDAAHSLPQLVKIASNNPLISIDIQLRDEEPFLIEKYLFKGTKSIPRLIVRNDDEKDLFVWGPRSAEIEEIFVQLRAEGKSAEDLKQTMQKHHNEEQGRGLQAELLGFLS